MFSRFTNIALIGLALAGVHCGGAVDETTASEEGLTEDAARGRPDVIECRTDDACPRGSYCEAGLNFCFTSQRCYVNGRPSDEYCVRQFGEDFVCLEYAPGSHHCVPVEPEERMCRSVIECRTDAQCPRGSFCESNEHYCLTGERCLIDSRPPHDNCARIYGDNFVCRRTPGAGATHCVPLELAPCE